MEIKLFNEFSEFTDKDPSVIAAAMLRINEKDHVQL